VKFLDRFSKNSQISNFMKNRPVGAEFFHADGRTDLPMLIVGFRNFANAPKNATHFAFTLVLYYIKHINAKCYIYIYIYIMP